MDSSIASSAVANRTLAEVNHNDIARMLRNGLAVVSFAALEDFIKKRSSEAMDEIGRLSVPFSKLPEKLQRAATYEAVSALSYQLGIRERGDRTEYIQEQALKIASTATANYELSDHTFAYSQANVNQETIGNILKSFNIRHPWREMSLISSRVGLTGLPLEESFRNAAKRRHRAAHVASTDTPQTDISQFVKEAFAIAISFDSLLSKALQYLRESNIDYIEGRQDIGSSQVSFRYIRYIDNAWKEYLEDGNRAYRTNTDLSLLLPNTKSRASIAKQLFLEFDENGLVNYWECS